MPARDPAPAAPTHSRGTLPPRPRRSQDHDAVTGIPGSAPLARLKRGHVRGRATTRKGSTPIWLRTPQVLHLNSLPIKNTRTIVRRHSELQVLADRCPDQLLETFRVVLAPEMNSVKDQQVLHRDRRSASREVRKETLSLERPSWASCRFGPPSGGYSSGEKFVRLNETNVARCHWPKRSPPGRG